MSRFDELDQEVLRNLKNTAAETAIKTFPFLRLIAPKPGIQPDWRVGDDFVSNDEAVANVDEATRGWVRYLNNKPVEERWESALGSGRNPPRPNSYTEESEWPEKWSDGRGKDPWSFKMRLPFKVMTGVLAGRVVLYNGDNMAGKCAISDLLVTFAEKRRRPLVAFAILRPEGTTTIFEPSFPLIRFVDDDDPTPGLNVRNDLAITAVEAKPRPVNGGGGSSFEEEIPFAPEWR